MKEIKQCEEGLTKRYDRWHSSKSQCPNNAKVERDGKWYCGTHDPVKRKEKQEKRDEKWADQWTVKEEQRRRRVAETHYCENLTTEYLKAHQAEFEVE